MQTLTPTPGPGIARGVPHLVGFRLDFADLADPQDPPLELEDIPGGAILLGGYVDVLDPFDDGAGSAITLELTFATVGDAIASWPIDAAGDVDGSSRALIAATGEVGARILDAAAPVAVGTTSAATDPYTSGTIELWLLIAELNG